MSPSWIPTGAYVTSGMFSAGSQSARFVRTATCRVPIWVVSGVTTQIGNLHVAVRATLADWDPAENIPLVTYAPVGIQEGDIQELRAYDADGRMTPLDPVI